VTRQAEANDVLVSVRAPVGQINVATELCGIGRGLASVRSEKHPHVLLQALSADGSIWLPYEAEGTVFGSINKKQFTQLEIGWPTAEFIDDLESQLSVLGQRIRRATEESRTLTALRDTLLPQLMSGKLRVRDAEKIVEDAV
jgi:type I restriction enzyme S subunit